MRTGMASSRLRSSGGPLAHLGTRRPTATWRRYSASLTSRAPRVSRTTPSISSSADNQPYSIRISCLGPWRWARRSFHATAPGWLSAPQRPRCTIPTRSPRCGAATSGRSSHRRRPQARRRLRWSRRRRARSSARRCSSQINLQPRAHLSARALGCSPERGTPGRHPRRHAHAIRARQSVGGALARRWWRRIR